MKNIWRVRELSGMKGWRERNWGEQQNTLEELGRSDE